MHTHIYSLSRAESRECRRLAAFTYGNTEDGIECENIFKLHCAGNSDGSQAVEVNCWKTWPNCVNKEGWWARLKGLQDS